MNVTIFRNVREGVADPVMAQNKDTAWESNRSPPGTRVMLGGCLPSLVANHKDPVPSSFSSQPGCGTATREAGTKQGVGSMVLLPVCELASASGSGFPQFPSPLRWVESERESWGCVPGWVKGLATSSIAQHSFHGG